MESTQLNVPSIACSSCSNKIEEGIRSMNGINNVNIDLKTQMVNVEFNPEQVKAQDIKKKISSMGYEVTG